MKLLATTCLPLIALLLLAACGSTGTFSGHGGTRAATILNHVDGSDPGFPEAGVYLINSPGELEVLGSELLTSVAVDFANQSMIVLALGEQPTTGWAAHINGAQHIGGQLYVQGTAQGPGEDEAVGQALTYPVAAVIVPKLNAEMIHPEIADAM